MINPAAPIGVFDSGVGGLTVLSKLLTRLPNEDFVFFGDTKNLPYGAKSKETITTLSVSACDFLVEKGVKAIVVACNSVSSTCLDVLTARYDVPIFGVIEPAVETFLELENANVVGVIGTKATVASNMYKTLIQRAKHGTGVLQLPCPLFVPIVEENLANSDIARLTVAHYLKYFTETEYGKIDALILGCTHYPLLRRAIEEFFGEESGIIIIDPAQRVAENLFRYLSENGYLNNTKNGASRPTFCLSDETPLFADIARMTGIEC